MYGWYRRMYVAIHAPMAMSLLTPLQQGNINAHHALQEIHKMSFYGIIRGWGDGPA